MLFVVVKLSTPQNDGIGKRDCIHVYISTSLVIQTPFGPSIRVVTNESLNKNKQSKNGSAAKLILWCKNNNAQAVF